MKICISALLLFSFSILSAQHTAPFKKELLGKWVVEKESNDPLRVYLINSKLINLEERGDVSFYVNYIGTLRLKYVKPLPQVQRSRRNRCGNYISPPKPRENYKDYNKEAVCVYDSKNGILKISDNEFIGGKLFRVEKVNFKEMILTKIK